MSLGHLIKHIFLHLLRELFYDNPKLHNLLPRTDNIFLLISSCELCLQVFVHVSNFPLPSIDNYNLNISGGFMRYLSAFLMAFALCLFAGCASDSCCDNCVDECTCNVEDGHCCCDGTCKDVCDCEDCCCKVKD